MKTCIFWKGFHWPNCVFYVAYNFAKMSAVAFSQASVMS